LNTDGSFFKRFTKIRGENPISSIRRLTYRGKISLGIQVPTIAKDKDGKYKKDQNGNPIQRRDKFGELEFHPQDVPHFVCPKEVVNMFGKDPTELDIAFPLSGLDENGLPDIGGIFPQAYKHYGRSRGLKCVGDGETAMKANEKGIFEEVECPCDKFGQKDGCGKKASLFFFIPKISMGGIYHIDSGSWNTMVDIQSGIYLALELLKDPITGEHNSITMLPFKLRRRQKETQHDGRKDTHWPLTCELDLPIEDIRKIRTGKTLFLEQKRVYQIPEIEEEVEKEGAVVGEEKEETEEEIKLRETKEAEKKKAEGEALKKDIEESRDREAQLKKDREEGKGKLKSYKESKAIHKKKVEEENKLLLAISEKAQKAGIDSFEKLVDFALEQGIIKTKLTEHIAKRVLATNKDIRNRLLKALEEFPISKKEISKEDKEKLLTNLFNIAQKAGFKNWKEIVGEGCRTRISDEEYVFDIPITVEEAKEILINDPERLKKVEGIFTAIAEAIDLG
jgi:hypothetical protein